MPAKSAEPIHPGRALNRSSFKPWSFLLAQIGGKDLAGVDDQQAFQRAASLFRIAQRAESHFHAISRLDSVSPLPSGANEVAARAVFV